MCAKALSARGGGQRTRRVRRAGWITMKNMVHKTRASRDSDRPRPHYPRAMANAQVATKGSIGIDSLAQLVKRVSGMETGSGTRRQFGSGIVHMFCSCFQLQCSLWITPSTISISHMQSCHSRYSIIHEGNPKPSLLPSRATPSTSSHGTHCASARNPR